VPDTGAYHLHVVQFCIRPTLSIFVYRELYFASTFLPITVRLLHYLKVSRTRVLISRVLPGVRLHTERRSECRRHGGWRRTGRNGIGRSRDDEGLHHRVRRTLGCHSDRRHSHRDGREMLRE
jgi:hypothetical protein